MSTLSESPETRPIVIKTQTDESTNTSFAMLFLLFLFILCILVVMSFAGFNNVQSLLNQQIQQTQDLQLKSQPVQQLPQQQYIPIPVVNPQQPARSVSPTTTNPGGGTTPGTVQSDSSTSSPAEGTNP